MRRSFHFSFGENQLVKAPKNDAKLLIFFVILDEIFIFFAFGLKKHMDLTL